jgi:hypothetical protein
MKTILSWDDKVVKLVITHDDKTMEMYEFPRNIHFLIPPTTWTIEKDFYVTEEDFKIGTKTISGILYPTLIPLKQSTAGMRLDSIAPFRKL